MSSDCAMLSTLAATSKWSCLAAVKALHLSPWIGTYGPCETLTVLECTAAAATTRVMVYGPIYLLYGPLNTLARPSKRHSVARQMASRGSFTYAMK